MGLSYGAGLLGGCSEESSFVVLSPLAQAALIVLGPHMSQFPYHTRYEYIEFAVLALASRVQRLVPLHAACVGINGRGILLMGPSGSGKSTVALQCILQGFDFLSEDAVFIDPRVMLATGTANFLHVQADSLRWVENARCRRSIRKSPIITRRSGAQKFEVDVRGGEHRLAVNPLKLAALVFLSSDQTHEHKLLRPLTKSQVAARLLTHQAYGARQPGWKAVERRLLKIPSVELRRGQHPRDAVAILRTLVDGRAA
jgi:hypothetical protein